MKRKTFIDENWIEQPLFVVQIPDSEMVTCPIHDEWSPNAFYSPVELARMMMEQGFLDCPYCLAEIVGIEG